MYLRATLKNCAAVHSVFVKNVIPYVVDGVVPVRNAEHHRYSDVVQRSLQEQRVYGGCLGFKER